MSEKTAAWYEKNLTGVDEAIVRDGEVTLLRTFITYSEETFTSWVDYLNTQLEDNMLQGVSDCGYVDDKPFNPYAPAYEQNHYWVRFYIS